MTTHESDILHWIELKGGMVTETQVMHQFVLTAGAMEIILHSLSRHLCIERDKKFIRITDVGKQELTKFAEQSKYVPFEHSEHW